MSKSNHLLLTLYRMEDEMLDIVDETANAISCVVVGDGMTATQKAKLKQAFSDGYASRSTLTKLVWKYIKDNDLNEGKKITIDSTLSGIVHSNRGNPVVKSRIIEMTQISKAISNGIDKEDSIKV